MSAIGYITMGDYKQEDVDEVRRWPTTLLFLSLLFGVSTLVAAFLRWTDYTSPYAATPPLTSPEWLTPERVIALLALLTALFALISVLYYYLKPAKETKTENHLALYHSNISRHHNNTTSRIVTEHGKLAYATALHELDPSCPTNEYESLIFVQTNPALTQIDSEEYLNAVKLTYPQKTSVIINPFWAENVSKDSETDEIFEYIKENEDNGWKNYQGVINIVLETVVMERTSKMEDLLDKAVMTMIRGLMAVNGRDKYIEKHCFIGFVCKRNPESKAELVYDAFERVMSLPPIELTKVKRMPIVIATPDEEATQPHLPNIKSQMQKKYSIPPNTPITDVLLRNEIDDYYYALILLSTEYKTADIMEGVMKQ